MSTSDRHHIHHWGLPLPEHHPHTMAASLQCSERFCRSVAAMTALSDGRWPLEPQPGLPLGFWPTLPATCAPSRSVRNRNLQYSTGAARQRQWRRMAAWSGAGHSGAKVLQQTFSCRWSGTRYLVGFAQDSVRCRRLRQGGLVPHLTRHSCLHVPASFTPMSNG